MRRNTGTSRGVIEIADTLTGQLVQDWNAVHQRDPLTVEIIKNVSMAKRKALVNDLKATSYCRNFLTDADFQSMETRPSLSAVLIKRGQRRTVAFCTFDEKGAPILPAESGVPTSATHAQIIAICAESVEQQSSRHVGLTGLGTLAFLVALEEIGRKQLVAVQPKNANERASNLFRAYGFREAFQNEAFVVWSRETVTPNQFEKFLIDYRQMAPAIAHTQRPAVPPELVSVRFTANGPVMAAPEEKKVSPLRAAEEKKVSVNRRREVSKSPDMFFPQIASPGAGLFPLGIIPDYQDRGSPYGPPENDVLNYDGPRGNRRSPINFSLFGNQDVLPENAMAIQERPGLAATPEFVAMNGPLNPDALMPGAPILAGVDVPPVSPGGAEFNDDRGGAYGSPESRLSMSGRAARERQSVSGRRERAPPVPRAGPKNGPTGKFSCGNNPKGDEWRRKKDGQGNVLEVYKLTTQQRQSYDETNQPWPDWDLRPPGTLWQCYKSGFHSGRGHK